MYSFMLPFAFHHALSVKRYTTWRCLLADGRLGTLPVSYRYSDLQGPVRTYYSTICVNRAWDGRAFCGRTEAIEWLSVCLQTKT